MTTATLLPPCVTSEPRAMTADEALRDICDELSLYPRSTPEQVVAAVRPCMRRVGAGLNGGRAQQTPRFWDVADTKETMPPVL